MPILKAIDIYEESRCSTKTYSPIYIFTFMSEDKEKEKKAASVAEAIQSKFIEDRKIFLWGEVSDKSARDITEKLLHLEATDPGKEITFYINLTI